MRSKHLNSGKLFVYGTLKSGFGNNRVLGPYADEGVPATLEGFTMVSLGGFPMLLEGGEGTITGEVYDVLDAETWSHLDSLEGYPNFYNRKKVTIQVSEDEKEEAWVYYGEGERYAEYPIVSDGIWKKGRYQ